MKLNSHLKGRRAFLGSVAIGGATVVAGRQLSTHAQNTSPVSSSSVVGDQWVAKINGKHRQVFDAVNPSKGWGVAFALNYLDSAEEFEHLTDKDFSAVVVMRHFAMPLAVNDAIWKKYKIGEVIGVTDPKTNAPATRNIFYNNIPLRPGLTYEKMIAERGVIIVVCNMALKVVSGMAADKVGLPKEEAEQDFLNGLFQGTDIAPSGVYAVNRAQEAGCTYCYAG